ncbi:MAG TPA: alanine racemase, partial [Candidatus Dormibacteraeota bacterium]|nr:alanine racemase [Candidatus Dormibacteraeota bacterium]
MPELAPAAGAIQETRDRVKRAYGSAIGRHRRDLVTPALILDLPTARRNIEKMADRLKTMPAKLRPHIKVHKSPELARMQVHAGAIGISTATVWEAVVMVRSGLDSIFVVNTIAGGEKLAALAAIARDAEVMVAVDDAKNAAEIAAAARAAGSIVGVLIEVDTGMDRAGVDTPEQAVELGRSLAELKGIKLLGVTGYEGHCSLTPERELRAQRQRVAMDLLVDAAEKIKAAGLPSPIVSAGGTATWDWTANTPGVTEIQAGSYAVMDNFHSAMVGDFEKALTVLATVISRPPDRVIVDAGNKSLGFAALTTIVGHDLPGFRFDEEHGVFTADAAYPLHVGDVVELVPGYAPGTVNWYDAYHVV